MTKHTVTLGADPEFFVTKHGDDKWIPACGLFGGEKGHPIILSDDGGFLEDGCAVEFNVRPAGNINELAKRIRKLTEAFTKKFSYGYQIHNHAFASFPKEVLKKHPQANVIGCGGDLAAWGIRMPPDIGLFGLNRFAGGHIHVGIDPWPEHLSRGDIIRYLDLMALLPNIKEQNGRRMRFYGSPGLYRETSYGVEWRSPDALWTSGGGGFIKSFDWSMKVLAALLANEKPIVLADVIGLVVEKFALLDHLQAVPFAPNSGPHWVSIAQSVQGRIEDRLEETPEARLLSKAREAKENSRYKVFTTSDAIQAPPEPIGVPVIDNEHEEDGL